MSDNGALLYNRFLNGDNDAFVEIFNLYSRNMMFFINGFVHNLSVSEELMEDTFAELIYKRRKFTENASFKTYLFKIAKNKALNYLKKSKREQNLNYSFTVAADEIEVENSVMRSDSYRVLYAAIQSLPENYRTAIYLCYFEDMSNAMIAKVLNKRDKQVRDMLYNAKKSLKNILIKEGFKYED